MTRILDSDDTRSQLQGILHLATQQAAVGLDLTVGHLFRISGPGSLDFGGSELQAARREPLKPRRRNEEDDYGWWELEPGSYIIRYNEAVVLEEREIAQVLPLERLLLAGASHPAFLVDGSRDALQALLVVGGAGCHLKENCRVSRLILMEV